MTETERKELAELWTKGTMALDVITRALAGAAATQAAGPDAMRALTHYASERLEWMKDQRQRFR